MERRPPELETCLARVSSVARGFSPEGIESLCARVCEVLGGVFSYFPAAHPCVSVRFARVPKLSSYMILQCSWVLKKTKKST